MALEKSSRDTMKAFILDRYGSADRVRAGDTPDPELPRAAHEVVFNYSHSERKQGARR
jgi:hypothetical protein